MESCDITISSLTSEPDDLTLIHAQSGLDTAHDSRHTDTGFRIDPVRLPNCVVLPASKKPRGSWIWEHGYALGVQEDGDVPRYWLCKSCYNSSVPLPRTSYLIKLERNTTKVIDHLEKSHAFDREGKTRPTKKRKHNNDLHASWTR
jgi:hypothetical protein